MCSKSPFAPHNAEAHVYIHFIANYLEITAIPLAIGLWTNNKTLSFSPLKGHPPPVTLGALAGHNLLYPIVPAG